MPTFETLLALVACSALAGQPVPSTACESSPDLADQCEVIGFPACFQPPEAADVPSTPTQALGEPVSWARGRTRTYIPTGFRSDSTTYDLILHFHGVPTRTQPAFQASGFEHAVLVTVNLGVGSGPYEDRFAAPGSFARLLSGIERDIAGHAPTRGQHAGRVALSAWSAGYGAVKRILAEDANRARIDAVLLADGLHAGFVDPPSRTIHAPRLAPFVAFAQEAAEGEKLMAMAHSSIRTTTYASTTETAKHLAHAVGIEPAPVEGQFVGDMQVTSHAERAGFRIQGFAGADANAHVEHLSHMDRTLLRQLRSWWEEPGSPYPPSP